VLFQRFFFLQICKWKSSSFFLILDKLILFLSVLNVELHADFFFFNFFFARILALKHINAEGSFASPHTILSHAFYALCSMTGRVKAKSDHI